MTKKNFGATISSSVRAQDIAAHERIEKADTFLSARQSHTANQVADTIVHQAKPSIVRQSFSMSEGDARLMTNLHKAAAAINPKTSASEIVRIGLHAIRGYGAEEIIAAINELERLRTGKK